MKRIVCIFLFIASLVLSACQPTVGRLTMPSATPVNTSAVSASPTATAVPVEETAIPAQIKTFSPFIENKYHPIVIGYGDIDDYMTVLGGSIGPNWYTVGKFTISVNGKKMSFDEFQNYTGGEFAVNNSESGAATDLIKGGETFKFFGSNGFVTMQTCKGTVLYKSDANGQIDYGAVFEEYTPELNQEYSLLMGINGEWDASPRRLENIDENTYTVDLEGDGKSEVFKVRTETGLLDAKHNSKYDEKTLVMVNVETEVGVDKSRFYCEEEDLRSYQIYAFDLNGDGMLEIVTEAIDDTIYALSVFEYQSGQFHRVLREWTQAE